MFAKRITKTEINELPLFKYEGKTVIAATEPQIDKAIFEIEKHKIVGFDTESKPAFKKGQFNHVALIQIAVPDMVYLYGSTMLAYLPRSKGFSKMIILSRLALRWTMT